MGKYLLLIASLGVIVGIAVAWSLRSPAPSSPTEVKPVATEVVSSSSTDQVAGPVVPAPPAPVVDRTSGEATPAPTAQPSLAASADEKAIPTVAPTPPAESPAVPTSPPSAVPERVVAGNSPYPAGGKPTGPFDIAWSFTVGTTHATGTITVKQLSGASAVSLSAVARGSAFLKQPFLERVDIAKAESHAFPVEVDLGAGSGSLVVTVTSEGVNRRARSITIDLVSAAGADPGVPQVGNRSGVTSVPGAPVSGSQTIRDDSGEVIELHPSTPQK